MKIQIKLFHLSIFSILILIASSCSKSNFSSKARYTKLKFINNLENNTKHSTQPAEAATAICDTISRNIITINTSVVEPQFDHFIAINNEVSNNYSHNEIELPSISKTFDIIETESKDQISISPDKHPENISEINKKLKNKKQNEDGEVWWYILGVSIPILFVIYLAVVLD